ncbi:hypothetical protein KIN20_032578 [Parelaphostrongylus tenuis]|uniref:Uncharacterized protein n=1 Tax=Parelaphostrongylus tenuis TaxID=148309 RepID=A0AAD5R752_PARTN|nr:hypothetical protein KIN20_032578 [Parelaphostrongylus tenuis]
MDSSRFVAVYVVVVFLTACLLSALFASEIYAFLTDVGKKSNDAKSENPAPVIYEESDSNNANLENPAPVTNGEPDSNNAMLKNTASATYEESNRWPWPVDVPSAASILVDNSGSILQIPENERLRESQGSRRVRSSTTD